MSLQPTPRQGSRRDRLAAASLWWRGSLVLVLAAPWSLALDPAMFGVQKNPLVSLTVFMATVAGTAYGDRDFSSLPGSSRRKVIAVQRSGHLSGDRTLDQIALDRLQRFAGGARSNRILLPLVVAIYVAVPVVAAIRGNASWLLCLLPAAVVAAVLPATWPEDPLIRRDRLIRSLAK